MKVVLVATGYTSAMEPLVQYKPTPLLKIVDKPILCHIIEHLVTLGCHEFDIVLNHLPQSIEETLEEGKRWGVSFTFHLARQENTPYDCLRPVAQKWGSEVLLLGQADVLPALDKHNLQKQGTDPLFYYFPNAQWSGWGFLQADTLAHLSPHVNNENLPEHIPNAHKAMIQPFISIRSYRDLVHSNFQMINSDDQEPLMPSTAHQVEPGIWISHAVSLHPSAKLISPVFIGENCQIKEAVQLGPQLIIENNCIVDSGSVLHHALVCQKSYIGEELNLHDSIVDRNLLINLQHESSIVVRDDFILSELAPPPLFNYLYRWLEQLGAGILLLLFSPIYLLMKACCKEQTVDQLKLPASFDKSQWQTFPLKNFVPVAGAFHKFTSFFQRLPVLWNIFRGDAHFVGVAPRTIEDAEKLPPDWLKLYQNSKVGLITLADLTTDGPQNDDTLYTAETYYTIHMGFGYDLKLFLRWLKRKLL